MQTGRGCRVTSNSTGGLGKSHVPSNHRSHALNRTGGVLVEGKGPCGLWQPLGRTGGAGPVRAPGPRPGPGQAGHCLCSAATVGGAGGPAPQ